MELVRASVLEVVRSSEVDSLIEDGTFKEIEDWKDTINDAISFLPHKCNSACQRKVILNGETQYKCRKVNNLDASKENTKHTFQDLPNEIPEECIDRLKQIGLVEQAEPNEVGYMKPYKSKLSLFHPKRHIPPTNPNGDLNISPVEGYTFANCRSMQNIQVLTQCGGVNKYVNKYIAKIDEQNYVIVSTDKNKNGELQLRKFFVHNSKVSKNAEDTERENLRESKHPQGRVIGILEMVHMLLQYPEVITNLRFESIQTVDLERRKGIQVNKNHDNQDGAYVGSLSDDVRKGMGLENWRQHRENEVMMIEDIGHSSISVDRISLFSLRPPELRCLIRRPGQYFRWFNVNKKIMTGTKITELLEDDVTMSSWVDGLQHLIRLRKKAMPEIMTYIHSLEEIDHSSPLYIMSRLFEQISMEMSSEVAINHDFRDHIISNLIDEDKEHEHLPCPVYSYLKPTAAHSFLHSIMLSMGEFDTEIDLKMHGSIREALRYAKLIGPNNDDQSLQEYSNQLLKDWIETQLQYFPNALKVLSSWIQVVLAGNLFDSVIVKDELAISDMPSVQLSALFGNNEDAVKDHLESIKSNLIEAIIEEIGEVTVEACHIPSKDELVTCSKNDPLQWNAHESFSRNDNQSNDSFVEQRFAIKMCLDTIERYCNLWEVDSYTKNICIRGFPGSGKTWCALYLSLYALSKGLTVVTTAILAKRAIQIGGIHYHKLFCLPIGKNMSIHRKAELAILKLLRSPKQLNLLLSLDVLVCDELGQISAEFLSTIDVILRRIRDSNVYLGGVLILGTIDHTQIHPIEGRPFLTSSHIITCFRMVALEHSVRAGMDAPFKRIQEIVRKSHRELKGNQRLVDEMIELCSNHLTFVNDWNDPKIDPQAMRLYTKKVPAKEAAKAFERRVRSLIHPNELRQKVSEDVQKARYSQMEWTKAEEHTACQLDKKLKEPRSILFFRGAIFECTFNDIQGYFTQSQIAVLFELPTMEVLERWKKVKVLVAPPGLKEIYFDETLQKDHFIDKGFKEVKIGIAPEHNVAASNTLFAKRKQYGIRHRVVMTVHAAQGDTLPMIVTRLSATDKNFAMWDKGQLVVILSRTKRAKDSIFVGPKQETLNAFRQLALSKTSWSDYMEKVLEIITINTNSSNESRVITAETYPFKIKNMILPQCNTGFVYMLMSLRMRGYIYIGTTKSIRRRLREHNSGFGSASTEPTYLRPYALIAYICGFGGGRSDLRLHIENRWKRKRDELIGNGVSDFQTIALSANTIIHSLNEEQFGIAPSELTLVCLFE